MPPVTPPSRFGYTPAGDDETVLANRLWWDAEAPAYLRDHGGDVEGFVWGPDGLTEADAALLGSLEGRRVLEVGAGGAQCASWLAARGVTVAACDLSVRMLVVGAATVPLAQCDGRALPFGASSFDVVFTAYGVLPFVGDPQRVHAEVARVLRPGGRWVFSLTHPVRWAFPDDPGPGGLVADRSYFDRTPYAERDDGGDVTYAEHHRTLGDRVREVVAAGFVLRDVVEPAWPDDRTTVWGGWSPLRGRLLPGTVVFVCDLPRP